MLRARAGTPGSWMDSAQGSRSRRVRIPVLLHLQNRKPPDQSRASNSAISILADGTHQQHEPPQGGLVLLERATRIELATFSLGS